jgi:hypothetical protein
MMKQADQTHAPWRRLLIALATTALSALVVLSAAGVADADPGPQPVTDYANYPADIPPACPQGEQALLGLSFSNGRGGSAATLWDLDVAHGDTVTMTWTGFHQGCVAGDGTPAVTVGLAAYETPKLEFDPTLDEHLLDGWTVCGVDGDPCVKQDGVYQLSITLPSTGVCNVQLDAFLGLPLAIVGPSGSFYSNLPRGSGTNRLISANHFGLQPCVEATTTTAAPTTTSSSIAPTTTEATTTTTTTETTVEQTGGVADTPTTPPSSPTAVDSAALPGQQTAPSTSAAQVLGESVTAPSGGVLPVTGSNTSSALQLAAMMTAAGVAALGLAAALRRRHTV